MLPAYRIRPSGMVDGPEAGPAKGFVSLWWARGRPGKGICLLIEHVLLHLAQVDLGRCHHAQPWQRLVDRDILLPVRRPVEILGRIIEARPEIARRPGGPDSGERTHIIELACVVVRILDPDHGVLAQEQARTPW